MPKYLRVREGYVYHKAHEIGPLALRLTEMAQLPYVPFRSNVSLRPKREVDHV